MKGSAHAIIGAAAGLAVAYGVDANLEHSLVLSGVGMVSGLIPDLDTGGKLANRISVSNKYLNMAIRLFGILLGVYAYFYADKSIQYICYIGAGLLVFVLPAFSKKFMLMLTGLIITFSGYIVFSTWLTLLGIYIIFAAFLPHRSYTHSLVGLGFYAVIVHYLAMEVNIIGLFNACLAGYASHLVADMRLIPGNKRGIKLFLPYKGIEL